jgi:hypothetical protein
MSQSCCTKELRIAERSGEKSRRTRPQPSSEIRVNKVLDIRRQLGEGTYSIADRLDLVVERLLEDLA